MARAALSALAALALAACAAGEEAEGHFGTVSRRSGDPATITLNHIGEPSSLDPGLAPDWASSALLFQLFEGLVTYHPRDGHPVQGVAVRYERSPDQRIYRFHLRPEARWSDGVPVTAADFEWAWKRVLRPETAARNAGLLYVLENGEAFHQGKLRVLRAAAPLLAAPGAPGAPVVAALPAGAAVRVRGPAEGGLVPVELADRPTFTPGPRARPPAAAGYLPADLLVEDDTVLGVRAAGEHLLEVELEWPAPYFVDLTGAPNLLPVRRDVLEAFARRGEPDLWVRPGNIVGNGAYTLESWRFQYQLTLTRNPHYWAADAVRLHRAVILAVDDQHATMNLYKTSELDYLGDNAALPPEYAAFLAGTRDYRRYPMLATLWYEMNTRRPPLDDVRVRRALHLAVDRDELVRAVLRGGQPAATHYVPDYTGGGYAEQAARDREAGADPFAREAFDPARARALLAEAGYEVAEEAHGRRARGFPPLTLLYNISDEHRQVAVAIQDMWRRHLGVSVALRAEEWRILLRTVKSGDFHIARVGWVADYDHPHSWLASFRANDPQNHTGWSDPAFDALVEAAASAPDPAESIRLYRKAERLALDSVPRLPLYFRTRATLVKPWVRGFHGHPRGTHSLRWLWIDPDWRDRPEGEPSEAPLELPPPALLEASP